MVTHRGTDSEFLYSPLTLRNRPKNLPPCHGSDRRGSDARRRRRAPTPRVISRHETGVTSRDVAACLEIIGGARARPSSVVRGWPVLVHGRAIRVIASGCPQVGQSTRLGSRSRPRSAHRGVWQMARFGPRPERRRANLGRRGRIIRAARHASAGGTAGTAGAATNRQPGPPCGHCPPGRATPASRTGTGRRRP